MRRLRVSRISDVERFCDFLRAVHVQVHTVDGTLVTATVPGALTPVHEARELSGYVTTWNALRPTSPVAIDAGLEEG
jgi:hypothetical protein